MVRNTARRLLQLGAVDGVATVARARAMIVLVCAARSRAVVELVARPRGSKLSCENGCHLIAGQKKIVSTFS